MDFPINLSKYFIQGMDEFKQTVELILKNPVGNFYQSLSIGALFSVHSSQNQIIDGCVKTLQSIPGVTVMSCQFQGTDILAQISYRDRITNFIFSIE